MSSDDEPDYSLDISDDELPTPAVLPTTNVTMHDLRQALNKAQEQALQLFEKNKKLRLHIADLTSQLIMAKKHAGKGRKRRNGGASDPELNHALMVKLGKSYAILVMPWIGPDAFLKPLPPNAPKADSKERFESEKVFFEGAAIELHHHLGEPGLIEKAISYPPFKNAFLQQVRQERGTAVKTLRECAPIIFGDLDAPSILWESSAKEQRRDSTLFKSLLKFERSPAVLSPIFYPDQIKTSHLLFLNEYQPKMLRAILFGKQSLTATKFNFSTSLLGMLWGVKRTNASCIALTAIIAQFLLSEDSEFEQIGALSKINYLQNFYRFKRLLIMAEGTDYSRQLYSYWDSRVFAGMATATTGDPDDADNVAANDLAETMINILRLDSSDTPQLPAPSTNNAGLSNSFEALHVGKGEVGTDMSTGGEPAAVRNEEQEEDDVPQAGRHIVPTRRGRGRGRARGRGRKVGQTTDTHLEPRVEDLQASAANEPAVQEGRRGGTRRSQRKP
ncbi:hypothetical protein AAF712_016512 [Marasmius tenuissimus]|uniref:Uncharacterized protein n=1 Tax=Marasmius tenuissimus TaxID=585030 RepID=A0ABR2Z6G3_9AGAR